MVDRAVEGKNQNYLDPENQVPDKMLPYPWESCMILGGGWSFSYDAKMMETRKVVHMLTDIVAKGGNLLLNIGPGPDGTWYEEAYSRFNEIGAWLKINGDAITTPAPSLLISTANCGLPVKRRSPTLFTCSTKTKNYRKKFR